MNRLWHYHRKWTNEWGQVTHGLHTVYPARNRQLAERILASGGCLLSEYAPGVEPAAYRFVERDRLQGGLSMSVIVAETEERGGTMKTVGFALAQHRRLACVTPPEGAAEQFGGNRLLISRGAVPLGHENGVSLTDFLGEAREACEAASAQGPA